MRDLRRLLVYLKPHWGKFTLATIAMLAGGLLQSAIGALIVPIFDQALRQEGSQAERTPTLFGLQRFIPDSGFGAWRTIALFLIVFTIAKGVAEYFSTYLMARVGQESVRKLREDVYAHLHSQSADFFERHRTNYLVSRLVGSAAAIETAVSQTVRDMLREGFTLICFLAASFYYSWRLTLGSLLIAPVIGFLTARFGRSLRNLARESFEGNQRLVDTAQEALSNQTIVKAYVAEEREQKRFSFVARQIMRANLRTAKINGIAPPTIEMVGVVAVAVLLFFAQREIIAGHMNAALFVTFLFFMFSSYDPMRKLSRLHNGMEQALAAARHVWEVFDEHSEMKEKPDAVALDPLRQAIELKHVHFNYGNNNDRPILTDINLRIPAGQMVALVGESGGGKSTLTKLIPRFHDPSQGAVLWDGVDLRAARLRSLRSNIAMVTQETVLFNDTVRYNISYSRPEASTGDIEEAARVAFAHDFIMELPGGYDTVVGERGVFLSGGQRQRLAIARAVLADACVLVLDEATSALDAESERFVQQALNNLTRGRTTLVIAHRLSTVRRADMIVVIERGRVVESGRHAELLAHGGAYQRLYELQFADEEEEMLVTGDS
ncbi:MAG: ABC transporter ATP-binding protein [Pyrinomonadaceae bacterium]